MLRLRLRQSFEAMFEDILGIKAPEWSCGFSLWFIYKF